MLATSDIHLACIGDLHSSFDRLRRVVEWLHDRARVDALLLTGDFAPGPFNPGLGGDSREALSATIEIVEELHRPFFFVPGNHDTPGLGRRENLDRKLTEWRGLSLYGIGGAGPGRFGFPYEWTDEEMAAVNVPECDILLAHAPPRNTSLDCLTSGRHVGSHFIGQQLGKCRVLVCGHIHEAAGIETIGNVLCYNAGSLGEPHGRKQVGLLTLSRGRWTAEHYALD